MSPRIVIVLEVVSPRSGGEAAKFGERYEGRWTVAQFLRVLVGSATSIVVEQRGEGGRGVEFVVTRSDGTVEAHQVKRQRGRKNNWTLPELRREGVLQAAAEQIGRGRRFWFVSLIPCRDLEELSDLARRTDDLRAFLDDLREDLDSKFTLLTSEWGTPQKAYAILKDFYVDWPSERHLVDTNAGLSELLLAGAAGAASSVVLGALAWDSLGTTLDAPRIEEQLSEYSLSRAQLVGVKTTTAVGETLTNWSRTVRRELLSPEIARPEADDVAGCLRSSETNVLLVAGAAGDGKSAVLHQAVSMVADDWPVLAMRLDQIEPFSSTRELGVDRLGLPASPVAALAATAQGGDCLLVVDQLDAVSIASGRMPTTFDQVVSLLSEASAFERMRVLLACRQFDIDNDHRLRRLVADDGPAKRISINPLTDEQVRDAVRQMDLDPVGLNDAQTQLLRSPLNLVLLAAVADQPDALAFSTAKGLMEEFYRRKRRDCQVRRQPPAQFGRTIDLLVQDMSANQRLFSPEAVLDGADLQGDADVLASEHVLVRSGTRIGFFHESFFDYAFARAWLVRDETLVAFLLIGEQELFRRAQVRQVLVHLRQEEPHRFVVEVEGLLAEPRIRFHIKEVVLALLRAIEDPTSAEWRMVQRQIAATPSFVNRLWWTVRTVAWFDRLDAEGVLEGWLRDGEKTFWHATEVMISVSNQRPDRLAALLASVSDEPSYAAGLRRVSFYVDLHNSRAMFELVLDGVRRGLFDEHAHDLFMTAHGLSTHEPAWGAELLAAWFVERPDALRLNDDGKVAALADRDHGTQEVISGAAAGDPLGFATFAVPFLLTAMARTDADERRPRRDRHFGYRIYNEDPLDADEALLYGARDSLRAMVVDGSQDEVTSLLESLAADEHDAAQWLLYQALAADGAAHSDWAVQLISEGEQRLLCGYTDSAYWTTRELVVAIAPTLNDHQLAALEQSFLALRPSRESRPMGLSSFTLLSALPEDRLSDQGRARLRELRRVFGPEPLAPTGMEMEPIEPPIAQAAAEKMTDDQWLRAIAKHSEDRIDWTRFTGGAADMARVLQNATEAEPERFARLALRLDETSHPAYLNAVLRGLRAAENVDADLVFDVIRHVNTLGRPDHDRALPDPLRHHLDADVPDDIIELLLDRATGAIDPTEESWQREAWDGKNFYNGDPFSDGMNTARGWATLAISDLLIHDSDGHRTALVAPHFESLAADPSTAVRSCVARLLTAGLRHARDDAVDAFTKLIEAPDDLLATRTVEELVIYVGFGDSARVEPVIRRMLTSPLEKVREAGGRLAAFAGLELDVQSLLAEAVSSPDAMIRKGAATICASRVSRTSDAERAGYALSVFFDDPDDDVRSEAAAVAARLRHQPLAAHRELLHRLIASPTFDKALSQLLITLEDATERVDGLVMSTAGRFIELHRGQVSHFANHAALDSRQVGELLLRAYAQAVDAEPRALVLDLIDDLLQAAAYDFAAVVEEAER